MTALEINKARNEHGIFSIGNEAGGWFAVSRGGVHMVTYYSGKFTFSVNDDVNRFYTEQGFAKKITKLLNGSF